MAFQARISGTIAYAEQDGDPASGLPLVLLHGIGSNAHSFAGLLPFLGEGRRVIAWNAPGYGRSRPLDKGWPEAADYAGELDAFLSRLRLPQVILVGHSLGALMGAAFALRAPARIASLVLASCALGHGVTPGGALSEAAQTRIDELTALGPKAFAARRAARLVHAPEASPDIVANVAVGMSRVTMPGYGQAARMLASGRLLDDLARISVPTSVIFGAGDLVTPPEANRRAHAAIPAAHRGPLVELPRAGHAIYQQDPAGFARAVAACLDATLPARAQASPGVPA